MYNHSEKPQVRYSLEQLSKSLFQHLKKRRIDEITITSLCDTAAITRRTFYRNCDSKLDLVLFRTDQLVSELLGQVDFLCTDPEILYRGFFRFWYDHRDFLGCMYANGLFDLFQNEFVQICNESMRYPYQEEHIMHDRDQTALRVYSNSFTIGGLGQMLRQWAADGFRPDTDTLVRSILFMVPSGN